MPAAGQGTAKEQNTPLLSWRDTLLLSIENGKKIIHHPVKAKQTLFSISKYYSIGLEELYQYNPAFRTDPTLRIGAQVKIPIPNQAIKRYKTKKFVAKQNASIYYRVQAGDNLFQISKRYFAMPVDSVRKRNRLRDDHIKPGQLLLMGWMGLEGISPEWRPAQAAPVENAMKNKFDQQKKRNDSVEAQGVCFWQKDSHEKGALYALHREALIGSIIAVTNPIYRRTVFATVIGRIPDGYENNIEIILSPQAARNIGAKDPRFFVKIKYVK